MKLRIRGNSIRLRLLQGEVATLGELGKVQETTRLGPAKSDVLTYALCTHGDNDDVSVQWKSGDLQVSIQQALAQEFFNTNQVSIAATLNFSDEVLTVLIEKDFRCLTDRPGEDESDNFENPQEKHECAPK